MNARVARQVLRAYHPGGRDDDERDVREALKIARRTPALDADFQSQSAFDGELSDLLHEELPAEVKAECEAAARKLEGVHNRKFSFRDPAIFTVGLSFLALVALVVWILMGRMGSFAGMQETVEIVQQGDKARAEDFQAIETPAGSLSDWFVMQSFDGFVVPRGLENLPVVGVRITRYNDTPVAVAAVGSPRLFFYAFEAAAFGVSLPEGSWKVVNYGTGNKRVMAVTQVGSMAFVMAPREGGREALEKFLGTLR
jgi:hypothetical protein